jgi:hypothetical protein
MADLQQRVVAFLEGRRTAELADLIQRHNGVPLAAPCLREVHTPDSPVLQASIERVLAADVWIAIFLTGVGTATVFESAQRMRRDAELRRRLKSAVSSRASTAVEKARRPHRPHRPTAEYQCRGAGPAGPTGKQEAPATLRRALELSQALVPGRPGTELARRLGSPPTSRHPVPARLLDRHEDDALVTSQFR